MVDSQFGNWLAGFIDGEGCFFIAAVKRHRNDGTHYYTYRPIFTLTLRHDDAPIIEEIIGITGLGGSHYYQPTGPGQRVIRWAVQSKPDTQELCSILTTFRLRAKKQQDFLVWKKAVEVASTVKKGAHSSQQKAYIELERLKRELSDGRKTVNW